MYSLNKIVPAIVLAATLAACGSMGDNLIASGVDNRTSADSTATGSGVGQNAPDFALSDTAGNSVNLLTEAAANKAVVLYFTMWCPVCSAHLQHMLESVIPKHPDVKFMAVDYVTGSVALSLESQNSNGFGTAPFTVIVDVSRVALNGYNATMATTVVIGNNGKILMNEDFKDGAALEALLAGL